MNKDKQIDEMAVENLVAFLWHNTAMYDEDLIFDVAEALYNAGYRKQSEPYSCGHEKGGEWIGVWDYECSVCNEYHDIKTKFCPNCGARMGGDDNDA